MYFDREVFPCKLWTAEKLLEYILLTEAAHSFSTGISRPIRQWKQKPVGGRWLRA